MPKSSYVFTPKLEEYEKKFSEYLIMERKNGILQVRMHTKGGPLKWSPRAHRAILEAWSVIGHDPENEVLILTSTDPYWIGEADKEAFVEWDTTTDPDIRYDGLYRPIKSMQDFIFDINIPTIGVINGPGSVHWDFAVLSDITLCAPDFVARDDHFKMGHVPGDGMFLCLQYLIGIKRANFVTYMSKNIDAKTALDWGIVNEVLPKEKLLPRAWEIAEEIMKQPRAVRRLTSQLAKRPWKRALIDDHDLHVTSEMFSYVLQSAKHDFGKIEAASKNEAEKK